MSESVFEYDELIDVAPDAAWAAMRRTSELDVMGDREVIERRSDSDWTCRTDERNTVSCHADYDEARRTVTVTMESTAKRQLDTTVIAAAEGAGTRASVTTTIRGGAVVAAMLKLVGKTGIRGTSRSVVRNIRSLARGGEAREMSADEVAEIAQGRLGELKERFGKHGE